MDIFYNPKLLTENLVKIFSLHTWPQIPLHNTSPYTSDGH